MNTENVSRDDWLLGGAALLLAIDLLFLPWFSFSVGPFTATLTATGSPDGWLGVIAFLAAIGAPPSSPWATACSISRPDRLPTRAAEVRGSSQV